MTDTEAWRAAFNALPRVLAGASFDAFAADMEQWASGFQEAQAIERRENSMRAELDELVKRIDSSVPALEHLLEHPAFAQDHDEPWWAAVQIDALAPALILETPQSERDSRTGRGADIGAVMADQSVLRDALGFLKRVKVVAQNAGPEAKRGAPAKSNKLDATYALVEIFQHYSGARATRSYDEKKPKGSRFEQFVTAVFRVAFPEDNDPQGQVQRAIGQYKADEAEKK